jgi:hypothetical protein
VAVSAPLYPLAPQPLAALELLEDPDPVARRTAREVLNELAETRPAVLARRSARAVSGPLLGRIVELRGGRGRRPPWKTTRRPTRVPRRRTSSAFVGVG